MFSGASKIAWSARDVKPHREAVRGPPSRGLTEVPLFPYYPPMADIPERILVFRSGPWFYGLPALTADGVVAVLPSSDFVAVPRLAPLLVGAVAFRRQVVAVRDMAWLLSCNATIPLDKRPVVVLPDGRGGFAAWAVEAVERTIASSEAAFRHVRVPPDIPTAVMAAGRLDGRPVFLLDSRRILAADSPFLPRVERGIVAKMPPATP